MTRKVTHIIALATALGIAALTATGCSVARDQQTVGSYIDDAGITAKVKAELLGSKETSAAAVKVDTMDGIVQLSGFVKTAEQRDAAVAIARKVANVRGVKNDIIVTP